MKVSYKDELKHTTNDSYTTDWFLLHNSIYGLHVDRQLCGSSQYCNASLLFAHQQVVYELCFAYMIAMKVSYSLST